MLFSPVISRLRAAVRGPLMVGWLAVCLLLLAASYGVIGWVVWPLRLEERIFPVHYTIYFGVDRVGPWWQVFMPAYLATGIFLLNVGLVTAFAKQEPLVARICAALTVAILVVLLTASALVALLNIA
ncbi:MAG: hypothetical protein AAB974_01750 [Patescibacteria group bacterium]